jgi:hypothetical protein
MKGSLPLLFLGVFQAAQGGGVPWIPFFNCSLPPNAGSTYCDISKDFETRAAALVFILTVEEKASLFMEHTTNITRLHQAKYNWYDTLPPSALLNTLPPSAVSKRPSQVERGTARRQE